MKHSSGTYMVFYFLLFIFYFAFQQKAKSQEIITLSKALDIALQNNINIKQALINESLAREDYKQAKYNMLPSFVASPQASYNFGRSPNLTTYSYSSQSFLYFNATASVNIILSQGGLLRNQILQNKLLLDVDKTTTAKVKNDLILNVVTDYITILTYQDLVFAAKQQVDIADISLERTKINLKAGNQTLSDFAQSKALKSTAELSLTNAQNQLDLAILLLKQYMEMEVTKDIVIEKPAIDGLTDVKLLFNTTDVIKTVLSINPSIRIAELEQQNCAQAIKIAQSSFYPTISLFGSVGSNYSNLNTEKVTGTNLVTQQIGTVQGSGQAIISTNPQFTYGPYSTFNQFVDNFNQSIGITFQIPIFNRFLSITAVKKAKLNYQYAKLGTQIAKNGLIKIIYQAIFDLNASVKSYQSAEQTFKSYKESLNSTQKRHVLGLVNNLDYNIAVTNFNKSEIDMIEAHYKMIFRSKVIDYYLGDPIIL